MIQYSMNNNMTQLDVSLSQLDMNLGRVIIRK